MKYYIKILSTLIVYIFAVTGFVLVVGYFGVKYGLTNTSGIIDTQRDDFVKNLSGVPVKTPSSTDFSPKNTEEWKIFKEAVTKDKEIIIKAANKADVSPRLIVANLAVEQLRLFYTNREVYKQVFAPLKILGVQSQFSWGVMGIKPETAKKIEDNLKNYSSPFYPGIEYQYLLEFKTANHDKERFDRMTDQHQRYYSYLYGAVYLREIISQWQKAGFDISKKPEIISTLYNIGFEKSIPNANPQVGGAQIDINGIKYSFGGLAADFYNSDELINVFPR